MGVLLVIFAGNAVVYLILAAKTMLSLSNNIVKEQAKILLSALQDVFF